MGELLARPFGPTGVRRLPELCVEVENAPEVVCVGRRMQPESSPATSDAIASLPTELALGAEVDRCVRRELEDKHERVLCPAPRRQLERRGDRRARPGVEHAERAERAQQFEPSDLR